LQSECLPTPSSCETRPRPNLDMLEMCDLPVEHASDERRLADGPVTQAAAQRWIEVLGEAASHVSDEVQTAHPEVAWREIAGIRLIPRPRLFPHRRGHHRQRHIGARSSPSRPAAPDRRIPRRIRLLTPHQYPHVRISLRSFWTRAPTVRGTASTSAVLVPTRRYRILVAHALGWDYRRRTRAFQRGVDRRWGRDYGRRYGAPDPRRLALSPTHCWLTRRFAPPRLG
jgi:hypothetical protein